MKKYLLGLLTGAIIFTGIGVVASTIFASSVTYDNTASGLKDSNNQDVTTVQGAIDALTVKANNSGFCKKITGNSATIGSKYECDPGDGTYRVFYVLKVNTDTVELIMDRNINKGTMDWNTASTYFTTGAGSSMTNSWTNVSSIALPKAQDVANAVGNTSWDVTTSTQNDWFYFDKHNGTYGQTQVANQNNISKYAWLFSNTRECYSYGCFDNTSLDGNNAYGYWTQDKVSNDNSRAWHMKWYGQLASRAVSIDTDYGVRPVITVPKSAL